MLIFSDKVPQPQTGVLKSDTPDELWEFTNPFFKRDHPEHLSRVTRKNNRPGVIPSAAPRGATSVAGGQYLITDGSTQGEAGGGMLVGPTGQQMLDLSAITSGIAAIRQTQASIGADLKALQTSNEHLWREAIEARDIHRKHEETIDLIVTFLERLFGTEGEGLKGLKEAMRRGGMGRTQESGYEDAATGKKRRRMGLDRMIIDGRSGDEVDENGQIVELPSGELESVLFISQLTCAESGTPTNYSLPSTGHKRSSRGSLKPEPLSATSELWSSMSQRFQALPDESPQTASPNTRSPNPPNNQNGQNVRPTYPANPNLSTDPNSLVPYNQSDQQLAQALNLDPAILQTTIGSLLQSPAAAEMFLNTLNNSIQGQALQQTGSTNTSQVNQIPSQPQQTSTDPTLALFSPLPNQAALVDNNDALLKSYQQAAAMGGDVEKLQESIDSLIRSMGLDLPHGEGGQTQALPSYVQNLNGVGIAAQQNSIVPNGASHPVDQFDTPAFEAAEDFDVDQFLHSLTKENDGDEGHEAGPS